jgi:hypothetical protein
MMHDTTCYTNVDYGQHVINPYKRVIARGFRTKTPPRLWILGPMDQIALKTPNPKCRLFLKIDL